MVAQTNPADRATERTPADRATERTWEISDLNGTNKRRVTLAEFRAEVAAHRRVALAKLKADVEAAGLTLPARFAVEA